ESGARLLELARDLPGVEAATISRQRPMGGDIEWIQTPFIRLPGAPRESIRPREVPVSAGFFQTMQIRWIAGRDFLPEEVVVNSPSVIGNQTFVDTFLRGRNPLGQRFEKLGDDPDPVPQQIVGVVGNARWNNLREPEEPAIYSPLGEIVNATLSVRTN